MSESKTIGGLTISNELEEFVRNEVLEGLDIEANNFWASLESILDEFGPRNIELLKKRETIQSQLDEWHIERKGKEHDKESYKEFLKSIGYLVEEGADFEITTENVDPEIKEIAGAQLVVPVMNARFSLNAANARWGSLYDALYGTDVISEEGGAEKAGGYNPIRGDKVIEFSKTFLNEMAPLSNGTYQDVTAFRVNSGALEITLSDQSKVQLSDDNQFVGYLGESENPTGILLKTITYMLKFNR